MRLQRKKTTRLEDKWDFFFLSLLLVLVYSCPLLSQIKTKVHSNIFLFPGRAATWQLRKILNPRNNCNLSPRLPPYSRNVPSGLGFQITALRLISEGSLLLLFKISYLFVCVDLKNGHADRKKNPNTTTNGSLKSLTVFVKVLFDVLTFQKLLLSVEPVSWETCPAVVGGWMVDLEEKNKNKKVLKLKLNCFSSQDEKAKL